MSRAFTKETAESAPPPERMVETGPNPVTPEGLRQIEAHVARLEAALQSEPNVLLRETLARDLRYWTVRKSTAEVVQPIEPGGVETPPGSMPSPPRASDSRWARQDGTVAFDSTVTIERNGRQQTFRIVGVDEADASKGLISFRAPLASAVLGARVGEIVEGAGSLGEISILTVEN